jgi:hypothetical protein
MLEFVEIDLMLLEGTIQIKPNILYINCLVAILVARVFLKEIVGEKLSPLSNIDIIKSIRQ